MVSCKGMGHHSLAKRGRASLAWCADYKAGSTRRTPFAYLKTEYSDWLSRFLSTASVFPHPSSPISPTPNQQTTVGPTRRPPLFLIHPPPPLSPPLFPRAASLSSPTAPPSPSSCRGPAGGPPLPAARGPLPRAGAPSFPPRAAGATTAPPPFPSLARRRHAGLLPFPAELVHGGEVGRSLLPPPARCGQRGSIPLGLGSWPSRRRALCCSLYGRPRPRAEVVGGGSVHGRAPGGEEVRNRGVAGSPAPSAASMASGAGPWPSAARRPSSGTTTWICSSPALFRLLRPPPRARRRPSPSSAGSWAARPWRRGWRRVWQRRELLSLPSAAGLTMARSTNGRTRGGAEGRA
jgi:hypothetical protein